MSHTKKGLFIHPTLHYYIATLQVVKIREPKKQEIKSCWENSIQMFDFIYNGFKTIKIAYFYQILMKLKSF